MTNEELEPGLRLFLLEGHPREEWNKQPEWIKQAWRDEEELQNALRRNHT